MNLFTRIVSYFKESKDELKKVAWPTRKEVVRNTILVIVISLFVAVFLGVLDIVFNFGLKEIL